MNTRDPFNLRRPTPGSPLQYIQSGARVATATANNIQAQLTQTIGFSNSPTTPALRPPSPQAVGSTSMSFAPRNLSSSDHSPRRNDDDEQWVNRRSAQNSVSEKIGAVFGSSSELPMYKDKPYNYASTKRRRYFLKQRRPMIVVGVILVGLLFWFNSVPIGKSNAAKSGGWFWSKPKSPASPWPARQEKVKEAFKLSWNDYEKHAWGYDEYHPLSKSGRYMVPGGFGWIIIDALDTMILMNLTTELTHARQWISTELDYDKSQDVNTFETTIRMLGGLLSAHYLSTKFPQMAPLVIAEGSAEEELYIEKATDLATRLVGAFNSDSGIPFASFNLQTMEGIPSHADGGASSTAEAATLQLELKYLATLTGEVDYWAKAEKVIQVIDDNGMQDGLLPIFIHPNTGTFRGSNIRLGSRGDSYYEYLIKQYLQTSKQEPIYRELWDQSLEGVKKHLITYSLPHNFTILGERPEGLDQPLSAKMDHLVCFMPGTIALGVTEGFTVEEAKQKGKWGKKQEADMELAIELMKTCWATYKVPITGLAPEITHFEIHNPPIMMAEGPLKSLEVLSEEPQAAWKTDFQIHGGDTHNLQRPETVESLFYMWRITQDPIYREWGWEMFNSFLNHTVTPDGSAYTSINSVQVIPTTARDNMESFWLAETLKYFFLLFGSDEILPLHENVFNTEAHPFPLIELGKLFKTGWSRKPRSADGKVSPRVLAVATDVGTAAPDAISPDLGVA